MDIAVAEKYKLSSVLI